MNHRIRVRLETRTDVMKLVNICEKESYEVTLCDNTHKYRISAKSTLGCILAYMEWEEVYVEYVGSNIIENSLREAKLTY